MAAIFTNFNTDPNIKFDEGIKYLKENPHYAHSCFLKAYRQGNVKAAYYLGKLRLSGYIDSYNYEKIKKDEKLAFQYFQKAFEAMPREAMAEKEYIYATYQLAMCYKNGIGVDPDHFRALSLLERLPIDCCPEAQYELGNCYSKDSHLVRKKEPNFKKAYEYYKRAADMNLPDALHTLGEWYCHGISVRKDEEKAYKEYYGKAAALGHAGSQYKVALKDKEDALKDDRWDVWRVAAEGFQAAADQGHAQASFEIGECFERGNGVAQDYTNALRYYRKSEELATTSFDRDAATSAYNRLVKFLVAKTKEAESLKSKVTTQQQKISELEEQIGKESSTHKRGRSPEATDTPQFAMEQERVKRGKTVPAPKLDSKPSEKSRKLDHQRFE